MTTLKEVHTSQQWHEVCIAFGCHDAFVLIGTFMFHYSKTCEFPAVNRDVKKPELFYIAYCILVDVRLWKKCRICVGYE